MISKETLPKVKESDSIMAKWRELVHSASMTAGLNAGLNFADMQMAAFTLGITIPGEDLKRYKTAAALAHDIVLILQGISGVSLDSPWKAHAQAPDEEKSSSSSAAPKVVLMRELNEGRHGQGLREHVEGDGLLDRIPCETRSGRRSRADHCDSGTHCASAASQWREQGIS